MKEATIQRRHSLRILLSLDLFALGIALLEDIIRQVVNGICGTNPVHINHALCQDWNDLLHQELTHVKSRCALQLLHVALD